MRIILYPLQHSNEDIDIRRKTYTSSSYISNKRLVDIFVTLTIAPFALIVVGVAAMVIRTEGGKPFFCQPRVGKGGKIFNLWKLRTMVPDAEQRLQEYRDADPVARAEWDTAQKLRHDPRITKSGKYLRKYSIDELPQLWNVLRGDMSLVGPRPMLPEQQKHYPDTAYFDLRPGLTGLWQINARNGCSFVERAVHDTHYAATISLATDLWILLRTPLVVVRGTGL